jgi:type IV pilus assembly protein PilV
MRKRGTRRSAGFSLIEVLISMVILSFALLGTAALSASGLKDTDESYYRSQATCVAGDILDRMRANVSKARGGQYEIDNIDSPTQVAPEGTLEYFDGDEWLAALADSLPGGKGTVKVESVSAEVVVATIVISWGDPANPTSFTTKSQL